MSRHLFLQGHWLEPAGKRRDRLCGKSRVGRDSRVETPIHHQLCPPFRYHKLRQKPRVSRNVCIYPVVFKLKDHLFKI